MQPRSPHLFTNLSFPSENGEKKELAVCVSFCSTCSRPHLHQQILVIRNQESCNLNLGNRIFSLPHHDRNSVFSITRSSPTGYGRMGAIESCGGHGARWSGIATRCESRARSTAIWMHLGSVLVLWLNLAMLRDSNEMVTPLRSQPRSRVTSHRESTRLPF